jgi:hypothetical protein
VPLADRARLDLALAEAVRVEERAQRLEHEQRRTGVGRRRVRAHDVVWSDGHAHGHNAIPRLPCGSGMHESISAICGRSLVRARET